MFYDFYPFLYPRFSPLNEKPPTLYKLMDSIVNFGKPEITKIKDLSKTARLTIFDFNYPLTNKINREEFECMILDHFIMRRIGFETPTMFMMQLKVKLNSIMPIYNKLFDMLDGWDLFLDGESITRDVTDNTTNNLTNTVNSSDTNIADSRYSEIPQNNITDVQNGTYLTNYTYDKNENTGLNNTKSNGTSDTITNESIKRSPSDKIKVYKEFIENRNSIYEMIFNDLESLFYQIA